MNVLTSKAKQREKRRKARETAFDGVKTVQREWSDLKPGDVVWFSTGWYEVADAYPDGRNTTVVKLCMPTNPHQFARIETYRVRGCGKATCRV